MVDYTIQTTTGNLPYAYTCEQVHVTLIGTKGKSEELELRKAYIDGFEQGQTDDFLFRGMPDLGEVTQVQIRLTPFDLTTSYVKAWFLDQVHIEVKGEDNTISVWGCRCDTWIGTDAGQQLSCIIPVTAYTNNQSKQLKRLRKKAVKMNINEKRGKQSSRNEQVISIAAQHKHN